MLERLAGGSSEDQKKPLPGQGPGRIRRRSQGSGGLGPAGGLDAAAQLAAEAEGGAGTEQGQGAGDLVIVNNIINFGAAVINLHPNLIFG